MAAFSHPKSGCKLIYQGGDTPLPKQAPLVDDLPFLGKPLGKQNRNKHYTGGKAGRENI